MKSSTVRPSSACAFWAALTSMLLAVSVRGADPIDQPSVNKSKPAAVVAGKKQASATSTATNQVARSESKTILTGSLIPRKVTRHGGIVDSPHNVYIIDRQEIERYGASTTADALRRLPGIGVTGR